MLDDTVRIENNYFQMRRLRIISEIMMKGDLSFDQINLLWFGSLIDNEEFFRICLAILRELRLKMTRDSILLVIQNDIHFCFFMQINDVNPLIQKFVDTNPDS